MKLLKEFFARFANSGTTNMADTSTPAPVETIANAEPSSVPGSTQASGSVEAATSGSAAALAEPQGTTMAMLTGLRDQVLMLQGEMQKLQISKDAEIKAIQSSVDVKADAKVKQIMLTETGIDIERLPKLSATTAAPQNAYKEWEAMPEETSVQRQIKQQFFEKKYDEIKKFSSHQ